MNTNEIIYDFILAQQDDSKKLLDARFTFGGDFEEYITKYPGGINAENDDKYDLLANKNLKYLFYQYHDFFVNEKRWNIKSEAHKTSEDFVRLVEIQKRHWQYLIERLIARAENLDMRDEIMKILTWGMKL